MSSFCDVALPVPLDRTFTYAAGDASPVVGGRVLVPFRTEKMAGIVLRVHEDVPLFEPRPIAAVMDEEPVVSPEMLELAQWIANYYIAPIGEVLRSMLPLMAEVKQVVTLRITDAGRKVLVEGASRGASRRSQMGAADQDREYAVLNYLENGDPARRTTLRTNTGASLTLLQGMVRKKWLLRETEASQRDARRLVKFITLRPDVDPDAMQRLKPLQQKLVSELIYAGGALPLEQAKAIGLTLPMSKTLAKNTIIEIESRPASFHLASAHLLGGRESHLHILNDAQDRALGEISGALHAKQFQPLLLHGVTGSGKTAVYLAAMRRALDAGRGAILLVPEIGLTPAMAAQVHAAFGDAVALLHSQLTAEERAEQWWRLHRGEARAVVGTRSAVFAPVADLGLLIVDEEHDGSYKQEETPRYHARDVAVMRGKLCNATVVLGSATPSLESWANAQKGRYSIITLNERVANRPLPTVELVDMRREFEETSRENLFSRQLIEETQVTLDRGEQAIILINRRGYSFVVMCRACGTRMECENCAIALTHHKPPANTNGHASAGQRLECHYCGYRRTIPKRCEKCDSEHLYFLGAGSQQGEEKLQELFPGARIGRMDRDTVRSRADMERLLVALHAGEINLLVGTQMIAKGHDIHGVTLVGVVGADQALSLPDFRAAERVFQLLTQVSGRAGRGVLPGRVLVQTYHTEHYAIVAAAEHNFAAFVEKEMRYRRWMHYPPNTALANVLLQSEKLEEVTGWAATLGRWFEKNPPARIRVLGPAAAPLSRIKRSYRFHFVFKAENRASLNATLRQMLAHAAEQRIPRRNITVDVDAVHLL